MLNVAIIGLGSRISAVWKTMKSYEACTVAAIADPRAAELKEARGEEFPDCRWYTSAEEMLETEKALDGVLIGTRCNLHTKYALLVAKYDLPLFLEKPVSITEEQLAQLQTIPHMEEKTVVSFPLRLAKLVGAVKEILDSGKIGTLSQVQAYNNVNYARGYYHKWYRDESVTGGLFLQKSTHDLDYITYLLGMIPKTICAMESKTVFRGDKPAGLACKDCADRFTCPESVWNLAQYDEKYAVPEAKCCFAQDTGNHDSATVLMQYENGLHAVYTQNFVARKSAGKRGARIIGYKGTVEFDFNTKTVTFIDHMSDRVDRISIETKGSHSGGDRSLARNFIAVMQGTETSDSPLSQGILSAKLCLAAKKSAQTKTFIEL